MNFTYLLGQVGKYWKPGLIISFVVCSPILAGIAYFLPSMQLVKVFPKVDGPSIDVHALSMKLCQYFIQDW